MGLEAVGDMRLGSTSFSPGIPKCPTCSAPDPRLRLLGNYAQSSPIHPSTDYIDQHCLLAAGPRALLAYEDPDWTASWMAPAAWLYEDLGSAAPYRTNDTSAVPMDQPSRRPQSDPNLDEALMDLYSVQRNAEVEQEVVPSKALVARAGFILRAMHKMDPRPYLVYAMPEGDVVIDADTKRGTKLTVICSDDGPTRCMFYRAGNLQEKEYADDTEIEDDSFLRDALRKSPQPND